MKANVFPGQGSQRRGMGEALIAKNRDLVAAADATLGYSLAQLCLDDPHRQLDQTEFTQPAIYFISYLTYLENEKRCGRPSVMAGHSVGEFAALAAAGAFDFTTGLKLVCARAKLMARCAPGRLAAIIGPSADAVSDMIAAARMPTIELANLNSPTQTVVGGPPDDLAAFLAYCSERDVRAVPLRVSGPFHTSLMAPAANDFANILAAVDFQPLHTPVIANLTAEPHKPEHFVETLSQHICRPVLWAQSVAKMLELGVVAFEEMTQYRVLMPMIEEVRRRNAEIISFQATDSARRSPRPARTRADEPTRAQGEHEPGKRAAAFQAAFETDYPLLVSAFREGTSAKLVAELAERGVIAYLDTEGADEQQIANEVGWLAARPNRGASFGVILDGDDDATRLAAIVDTLARHEVRHVSLRRAHRLPPALEQLRRSRARIGQTLRVLANVSDEVALENFFAVSDDGDERQLNADAMCVDLQAWRSPDSCAIPLLLNALGRRDAFATTNPHHPRLFIGASGLCGSSHAVDALLALGADFAVAGTMFLTARESGLHPARRSALLAASYDRFRRIPDWSYPEFASTQWRCVTEDAAVDKLFALQQAYLRDDLDVAMIQRIVADAPEELATLVRTAVSAQTEPDAPQLRRQMRIALNAARLDACLPCDTSLLQWNAWRHSQNGLPEPDL